MENSKLISKFSIGDSVVLDFYDKGARVEAFVSGISFTESKVFYDLDIYPFDNEESKDITFSLCRVDSYFVRSIKE